MAVAVTGVWLATGPLRGHFGFAPLPAAFWPILAAIVAGYALATQALKTWLVRGRWID